MAKVGLGVPTHSGSIAAGTAITMLTSTSSRGHHVEPTVQGLSLLAHLFNILFAQSYKRGDDYFVLLHSDISASAPAGQGSWIDLMVDRMEALNAAVLSYASPIKGPTGHLSAGMFLEPGNLYSLRRATMHELHEMPQVVITRTEMCRVMGLDPEKCGAMMVNTGCMIMNLRKFPWWTWPGFNIHSELSWSPKRVPRPYCVPEDWGLSAWLHERGWPFYMSRELTIEHAGTKVWHTGEVWGDKHDVSPILWTPQEWAEGKGETA